MGFYFGLFGLLFNLLCKKSGVTKTFFFAPFIWVSLEYVRSNLSFLSLPWVLLSHSQYQTLAVIQISSVTGACGVSFLILLVNASLSAAILAGAQRLKIVEISPSHRLSQKGTAFMFIATAALTGLVLLHGKMNLSRPIEGKSLKLSVVQGNIEQAKKWDRRYRSYIIERYEELSREASKDRPKLVIWPEAATPGFVLKDMTLLMRITALVREMNTYFLIGSSEYPKFQKGRLEFGRFGNTALFFSPDGKVLGQYLKIHLVPFAEYVPYEKLIPWPRFIVPQGVKGFEVPGDKITLFDLQGAKFGALICWEIIFPGLPREFVKSGAQFLINITNEGWFGRSAGPQHYVISSIFRAVENRVYVVRCANTGISCFIDPYGRIVGRVKDENNEDLVVRGVLTENVIPIESIAAYTRWGDWLAWICVGLSLTFIIVTFLSKKPDTETPTSGKILDSDQLMCGRKRERDESTPYSS
jgi:apolipoprotein N-acyltransferase